MRIACGLVFLAFLFAACGARGLDADGDGGAAVPDAGTDGTTPPEAGMTCAGGSSPCGTRCVDLLHDPANCGTCASACGAAEVCSNGACRLDCAGGSTRCGGGCVDLVHDTAHCGACTNACDIGQICANGTCRLECLGGSTRCGASCVDTLHDPANCGGCAKACLAGQVCSNGACGLVCLGGTLRCGDRCVEITVDPANCGACGSQCDSTARCVFGVCVGADGGGADPCSPQVSCSGRCVDTSNDPSNCGGCARACPAGQMCTAAKCVCATGTIACGARCADPKTDSTNCGGCGIACRSHEACANAQCVCAPGATLCGTACVDTAIDSVNCGGCGALCSVGNVCTDGQCSAPTSDWPTLGADAQRSGVNALETGKPPLRETWTYSPVPQGGTTVAVYGGRVLVSVSRGQSQNALVALNASDGTRLWSYNLPAAGGLSSPTADGGRVYVESGHGINGGTDAPARLHALDVQTGSVQWSQPIAAQWERYWAPLVANGSVYVNGGTYGGLYGFDAVSGNQLFFQQLEQYDNWSAAYGQGSVLTFVASILRAHDRASGAAQWQVQVSTTTTPYSMFTAPVVGGSHAFVIAASTLHAVGLTTHVVDWSASGGYTGTAAYRNELVFGVSGGTLVARDGATGQLVGSFAGDQTLRSPIVFAGGFAYVASATNVFAVDLATYQQAWTAPMGGAPSVAARRLFLARADGSVTAFVMSR